MRYNRNLVFMGILALNLAASPGQVIGGPNSVKLNQLFYGPGDDVTMTVKDWNGTTAIASLWSKIEVIDNEGNEVDVEFDLAFSEESPGVFLSDAVPLDHTSTPVPKNGVLEVLDLEYISATYSPKGEILAVDSRPFRSGSPTLWRGLPVFPLGDANLSISPDDHLVIDSLGSDGGDGAIFYTFGPGADVSVVPLALTMDTQAAFASASAVDGNGNWLPPNPARCPPKPGFLGGCSRNGGTTRVLMCCYNSSTTRFAVFDNGTQVGERFVALLAGPPPTRIADVIAIAGIPNIMSSTAQIITGTGFIEHGVVIRLDRTARFLNIAGFPTTQFDGDEVRLSCPLPDITTQNLSELSVLAATFPQVVLTDVVSVPDASFVFTDGFESGDTTRWSSVVGALSFGVGAE